MIEDIRSEIWEQYILLSTYAPPTVICWIKYEEKMEPMGFSPPRKAAAMPLKPMAGTADWPQDREVEQTRAEAGESAADKQRQYRVALFGHAAVFCRVLVKARGLELIAKFGLLHHYVHQYRYDDRDGYRYGDILVVAEQLVKTQRGDERIGVYGSDMYGVGAGGLLDSRKQVIHRIEGYPVEHDA